MQSNYRAPDIPRLSRDEMLTQAQNLANLQIDPIIQSLMRGKEDYLSSYESAKRNIEGLILQKNKSLDEQARLFALLEALPDEEPEPGAGG